jgi:hypothetical protein
MDGRITHDELRSRLHYEPATGAFTWLFDPHATRKEWNYRWAGHLAGTDNGNGYIKISIDGTRYYAHRLAWFWMTGRWPALHIDHKNGIGTDNSWANLREATRSQNLSNRGPQQNNQTGLKGVVYHRFSGLWHAVIQVNKRVISLGYYVTPEQAHEAYKVGADRYHQGFARYD